MQTTKIKLSVSVRSVHSDFMVSREAIGISHRTYKTYDFTLEKFYAWLDIERVYEVGEAFTTKNINGFLAYLRGRENKGKPLSDRYIHIFARVIKTLVRFAYEEHYINSPVQFKMPPIRKTKLLYLDANDIPKVLEACNSNRDLALVTLAIASGLILSEINSLNWGDINLKDVNIIVLLGKGGKFRVCMVDKGTLRFLIRYHNELRSINEDFVGLSSPAIQTDENMRLKAGGLRSLIDRISRKSGVKFTAHALRRAFARLSIKNGMDIIWLQFLMGHSNLETTRDYVQDLDVEDVEKFYLDSAPLRDFDFRKGGKL
jgi:integrase